MFCSKLSAILLLSLTCACLAFDDMTGMIRVFCDAPEESYDHAVQCLDKMPETFQTARKSCMEEIAGTDDKAKFKKELCDNSKDVANEMRACLFKKASTTEYEATAEDAIKGLETLNCIRKTFK